MKAAVLYGPEDVRLEEIAIPEISAGEVLVEIKAALTCGTDAKVYLRGGHPRMIKPPAVFGHEFSGIVAAVGEGVSNFTVGDRVVAANSAPCNLCTYCKLGRQSLCDDLLFINGAYAQYVKIPRRIVEQNLLLLPEAVPFKEAALVEPLACVLHGVDKSGIRLGDIVAVNGAGPIGLFFIQLAKKRGAYVIASDMRGERLKAAERCGADRVVKVTEGEDQIKAVRSLTEGDRGVDVAIEAAGVPAVWEKTIAMVRKGGIVNLFGGCAPGTKINIDTKLFHYHELTIKAVFHHTPYYITRALDMISRKELVMDLVISRELPLEKLPEALNLIVNKKGEKTAIIP